MYTWIILQQWAALIPFVLAVDGTATSSYSFSELTGSVSSSNSSSLIPSSVTPTISLPSTVVSKSTPVNASLTSPPSGPPTQPQSIIPISPASFSPFSVPSDVPIPSAYPAVDPSQPPAVSSTCHVSFYLLRLTSWIIFHRWALLIFPISDPHGQWHTLKRRQR